MYRRQGAETSGGIDWLPWGLSIFGACCAVFVLVRGVLPERSVNRELVQRVARLETDLTRARQEASVDLARAKEQLSKQALAAQAEVSAARDQERLRAAREMARRDLGQALASEIAAGDVAIQERADDLVLIIRDRLLFPETGSKLEPRGKRLLRDLGASMQRLPAEQVYRISSRTEKQEQKIARFLEIGGRVPHEQLLTAGTPPAPAPGSTRPSTVEITIVLPRR